MPFGYEKYRLSKGISPNTTITEVRLLQELLAYVNFTHKRKLEPREIKPIDIKNFLIQQKEEFNLKDSTINRKLITIKNWYSYLWEVKKIENDFMPKFKLPHELELKKDCIEINYEYLLLRKNDIINSTKVQLYGKMLYILYMKGFRVRDIVGITINNIHDEKDKITIQINKENGCIQKAEFKDEEIGVILSCIERAIFRGTDYLLSSKVNNEYIPLQLGSFKNHLNSIHDVIEVPFRSEQIRLAYTHYLYKKNGVKAEDLQETLGLPLISVTRTIKEALERIVEIDYTKKN